MTQPLSIMKDVLGEQTRTRTQTHRWHGSVHIRSYLWQIIRSYAARCSMASWGLPFEAIAASMLLRDRTQRKPRKKKED